MTPDQLKRIEAMLADTDGLKECPFCGSIDFDPDIEQDENGGWSINCLARCEAGCGLYLENYSTKEYAMAVWNHRAYLEPVRALYEDYKWMREALEAWKRAEEYGKRYSGLIDAQEDVAGAYEYATSLRDKALNPPEET